MDAVRKCASCKHQYLPGTQDPCHPCSLAPLGAWPHWEPSIDEVARQAAVEIAKDLGPSALDVQVGGDHYKSQGIQPVEYIFANSLGFCEGNVVKYVTRYGQKNGVQDLKKARHYLDMLIERLEKTNASA